MKLFTHNLLTSRHIKGVKVGYPLKLTASEVKQNEMDFNPDFIKRIASRLDWLALRSAAESIGVEVPESLPKAPTESMETEGTSGGDAAPTQEQPIDLSDDSLKQLHHALMEVEVVTGTLECPETGRKFNITDGIPNMIAREDEI